MAMQQFQTIVLLGRPGTLLVLTEINHAMLEVENDEAEI